MINDDRKKYAFSFVETNPDAKIGAPTNRRS